MKRYNPILWESPIGEPDIKMQESKHGTYVTHYDYMIEVTKLKERIAELEINRDVGFHGDV